MNIKPSPPQRGLDNNGRLTGVTAPGASSSSAAAASTRNNFSVIGQPTANVSGIVNNVSNPYYHNTNRKRDRVDNISSNRLGLGDELLPSTKRQHTKNSGNNIISAGEPQQQNSSYDNNGGDGIPPLSYSLQQQQQSQSDQYNFSDDKDMGAAHDNTSKLSSSDEFYNSDIDGEFGNNDEVTAFLAAAEAKSRASVVDSSASAAAEAEDGSVNFSDDHSFDDNDLAAFAAHDKPIEVEGEDLSHTQQLGLLLFKGIMDKKLGKLDAVNGNTLSIVIGEERVVGPKLLFFDGIFEHVMKHDNLISSLMSGCNVCIGLLQNIRDECESAFSNEQMCLLRSVTHALTILGDISPSYDSYPGECVGGMERGVKMEALNGCKY